MLVALGSIKGSPGVSSAALVLAAVWPRPVVLVEADPVGGDLAYRCSAAIGGAMAAHRGLLRLGAAVRGGGSSPSEVMDQSQRLGCGVNLVQGVSSSAQARGLVALWPAIARACVASEVDVIVDLGRVDRTVPTMALALAADVLVPVAAATLESVFNLAEGLQDVAGGLAQQGQVNLQPVLVGPDAHRDRDCGDLDNLLTRAGLPIRPTRPLPVDPKALQRLVTGERADGRLGRTLLLRGARMLANALLDDPTRHESRGPGRDGVETQRDQTQPNPANGWDQRGGHYEGDDVRSAPVRWPGLWPRGGSS